MKLGSRRNYHKGQAAIRHYANQPLNVEALVGAFKQEKSLEGDLSMIVKSPFSPQALVEMLGQVERDVQIATLL